MGTVPTGTGELRMIHSRVAWMSLPVDRSMIVSAPHRVAQRIFSTSASMLETTAELPMLAFTLTRNLVPMIIGSASGWLMFAGMIARPRATIPADGDELHLGRDHICGHALADGDELHLGRDHAAARVVQLGDRRARPGAPRRA